MSRLFPVVTIAILLTLSSMMDAYAEDTGTLLPWPSSFQERQEQYNADVVDGDYGVDYDCHRNLLWGYLEKEVPTDLDKQKIHLILRAMIYGYQRVDETEPDLMAATNCRLNIGDNTVGFFKSVCMDTLLFVKLMYRYRHLIGERIRQDDLELMESEFVKQLFQERAFVVASNGNQHLQVMPAIFLYTDKFAPDMMFTYPDPCEILGDENGECSKDRRWVPFSYNGNSYEYGGTYNARQFSRDWLEWTLDKLVFTKDFSDYYTNVAFYFEFDGKYPHAYMNGLANLCDLAEDQEIRNKACMVFDLFVLDYFLDYNGIAEGGMHGGNPGRSGHAEQFDYDYLFFGIRSPMHPAYPERNLYFIDYRLPDVVRDVIVIEEESADYWHINLEYNPYLNNYEAQGKYTLVSKSAAVDCVGHPDCASRLASVCPDCTLPFDRIETVDWQGNKMVDWQDNVMTVSKNDQRCIYDFNVWTKTGDCYSTDSPLDRVPPNPPTDLRVRP